MYRVIVLFILLSSCTSIPDHEVQETLESKKSISFDVGFTPDMKLSGFFRDSLGNEFFYFSAYLDSKKETVFFDLNGTKIRSISLSALKIPSTNLQSLEVINHHKIILTGQNGEYYELNEFGEITKTANFNAILEKVQNGEHYVYPRVKSNCIDKKCTLYVLTHWFESDSINYASLTELSKTNFTQYLTLYNRKIKASPLAYKLNIDDSLSAKTIFHSFSSTISSKQEFIPQFSFPHFGVNKHYFFFTSRFSDSLWRYNLTTEKIEGFQLKSKLVDIGIKPIKIDPNRHQNLKILFNDAKEKMSKWSYISFVHYDQFKKLYYVVIKHNNSRDAASLKDNNNHSVLVLDEKMNLLNEYLLPEGNFISLSWVSKTGLVFARYDTDKKDYDPRKYTVEVFDVNP